MFEVLRGNGSGDSSGQRPGQEIGSTPSSSTPSSSTASGDSSDSRSRRRVELDDPAKGPISSRRLPPLSEGNTSTDDPTWQGDTDSFLSGTIEFRKATVLVFALAFVVLLALSYLSGKSNSTPPPPAGLVDMQNTPLADDAPWAVLDPEPEIRPAVKNIIQDDVAGGDGAEDAVAPTHPAEPEVLASQTLYAVMIGQQLSSDPAVIDKLVQYVDSGLDSARARVRLTDSRRGKRFSVFVGPFPDLDAARTVLREIQVLRPHAGVRFRDAFPTKMVFSAEELQNYQSGN